MMNLPPFRSHLYAPGNKPELMEKVYTAGADAVVLDLEDAVPASDKGAARERVAAAVQARAGKPGPATFVRINDLASPWAREDIRAVVRPGLTGLRLPKVEDAEMVRQAAAWVEEAEAASGQAAGSIVFICTIESAAGAFHAVEICRASARVLALGNGAADMARDLGVIPGPEGMETLYVRSQLVLAARVAGVKPPIDSVFRKLDDVAGLERSIRQGKALGFFGKSAIHPSQVPVINSIYTPSDPEIKRARELVAAASAAESRGTSGVGQYQGEFVDAATLRRAKDILDLAERLGIAES